MLVNQRGKRFTDQAPGTVDAHCERVMRRIDEQEGGIAYVVLDARHMTIPNYRLGIRTDTPPITGATVEVLAGKLKIPADTLQATLTEFNRSCISGH